MFLYVSGAKGLKTDEKRAKFAHLAESVPEVSEMTILVPGSLFWNKKSKMVLGNSQVIKFDPWIKSLRKLQFWSLKFQKWQKQSLGILNWKTYIYSPCTIYPD